MFAKYILFIAIAVLSGHSLVHIWEGLSFWVAYPSLRGLGWLVGSSTFIGGNRVTQSLLVNQGLQGVEVTWRRWAAKQYFWMAHCNGTQTDGRRRSRSIRFQKSHRNWARSSASFNFAGSGWAATQGCRACSAASPNNTEAVARNHARTLGHVRPNCEQQSS